MKRHIIILSDAELSRLRGAIRTTMEEDCGKRTFNQLNDLLGTVNSALPVTKTAWGNLHHAIGNSLADEPEDVLPNPKAAQSAIRIWEWLNKHLGNFPG